jgi:hypothetical protein
MHNPGTGNENTTQLQKQTEGGETKWRAKIGRNGWSEQFDSPQEAIDGAPTAAQSGTSTSTPAPSGAAAITDEDRRMASDWNMLATGPGKWESRRVSDSAMVMVKRMPPRHDGQASGFKVTVTGRNGDHEMLVGNSDDIRMVARSLGTSGGLQGPVGGSTSEATAASTPAEEERPAVRDDLPEHLHPQEGESKDDEMKRLGRSGR